MTFTCRRERGRWLLRCNGSVVGFFPTLGALVAARLTLPLHSGQNT